MKRLLSASMRTQKVNKRSFLSVTATRTGVNHGRVKLVNQDSAFVGRLEAPQSPHFLLICDGHGDSGHNVSSFLTQTLPSYLADGLKQYSDTATHAVLDAYRRTNEALKHSGISARCSGSTCVSVLVLKDRIVCGNVGDSRAVLARRGGEAVPLSKDHKPGSAEERERIEAAGGKVAPMGTDASGLMRAWFDDEDGPGLAVSRAMGDFSAQEIGIIATPGEN